MAKSIEEFKEFVKKYPKLKFEVRDNKRTWQSIYEEWALLGDDGNWDTYKDEKESKVNSVEGQEFLRNALQYVKKLNPDDITKTIGTIQKVVGLVQSFNIGSNKNQNNNNMNFPQRRRVDPLFRRFDDFDE